MSEQEDDDFVSNDFYSLIGGAQLNELREAERQREIEREARQQLAQQQDPKAMTLTALAGMRSKKEIDALAEEKNALEDKRMQTEEQKRKEQEHARLVNKFPPPDLKHNP